MSGAGVLGVVTAGGLLYSSSIVIRPKRGFTGVKDIVAQVTIEEVHRDEVQITEHPVEQGANIADHAFEVPASLIVRYGWSNSPSANNLVGAAAFSAAGTASAVQSLLTGNSTNQVRDVYKSLLDLKSTRQPFSVFTSKRKYDNMLIKSISVTTDKATEQALMVTIELKQVLIVSVSTSAVSAPAADQANPSSTAAPVDGGNKSLMDSTGYDPSNDGRGF